MKIEKILNWGAAIGFIGGFILLTIAWALNELGVISIG